jgi:hypothetical protein
MFGLRQGNYGSFQADTGTPGFMSRMFPAKKSGWRIWLVEVTT